ncbi:hypothetical protein [Francisella uliginis]|uniref:Uncharacterized protein n=1 Tax=Francisella uliginis TaxID=573570 RepID=A0A1L4BSG6_9GAMM|nr:hypothetical protein [Francisella uliginis]API86777.1 hypothetical protein F7310_05140 [Francisella uliginis]
MLYDLFQLVSNKLISIDWCVDKNGEINKQYIVFKYRFGQTKKVEVKNGYAISKNIRFKIYDENIPIIENTEFENCIFLKNTSFTLSLKIVFFIIHLFRILILQKLSI